MARPGPAKSRFDLPFPKPRLEMSARPTAQARYWRLHGNQNVIDDSDLRAGAFCGVNRAHGGGADGIRRRNAARREIIHRRCRRAGNYLAGIRAWQANLTEDRASSGDSVDTPVDRCVGSSVDLDNQRDAMTCGERGRPGRNVYADTWLDGDGGLRLFRWIGLRSHCDRHSVGAGSRARGRVSRGTRSQTSAYRLRGCCT